MAKRAAIFCLAILLLGIFGLKITLAGIDARKKVIELLTSAGLGDKLNAGVRISAHDSAVVCIADEGSFFMQYIIAEPNVSAEPNVIIDPNVRIPFSCNKAVIVTHGWIDKADSDWPTDIAEEIAAKVDANEWVCAFFDWRGGAAVVNPVDAAKYARDIAAPRLAAALLRLVPKLEHVHLIGHSAGCWAINSAAAIIAQQTDAQIHLTFLDAYVPPFWDQAEFAGIEGENVIWAEHYYTKDITLGSTQKDFSAAHNVDITAIDPVIKEHKFPYRWYYATVAGRFRDCDREAGDEVLTAHSRLDYGFARSREAGRGNWERTIALEKGNKAVKLKRPGKKKFFDLKIFKHKPEAKK